MGHRAHAKKSWEEANESGGVDWTPVSAQGLLPQRSDEPQTNPGGEGLGVGWSRDVGVGVAAEDGSFSHGSPLKESQG